MSKTEKLLLRLLTIPKDFTWEELTKLLTLFGYKEYALKQIITHLREKGYIKDE